MNTRENIENHWRDIIENPLIRELFKKAWRVEELLSIVQDAQIIAEERWWSYENPEIEDFYHAVHIMTGVKMHVNETLWNIPQSWWVILAANHPYPPLDWLKLLMDLKKARPNKDARIVVNRFAGNFTELKNLAIVGPKNNHDRQWIKRFRWELKEHIEDECWIAIFPAKRWVLDTQWQQDAINFARKLDALIVPTLITWSQVQGWLKLLHRAMPNLAGALNGTQLFRSDVELHAHYWRPIRDSRNLKAWDLQKQSRALQSRI